jgi:hypothetical protein
MHDPTANRHNHARFNLPTIVSAGTPARTIMAPPAQTQMGRRKTLSDGRAEFASAPPDRPLRVGPQVAEGADA